MAFIIKCDPFPLHRSGRVLLSAKRYKAAAPSEGDALFLWFSEAAGGAGLAGHGVVQAVGDSDPIDIAVLIEATAPPRPLNKSHVAPYRDTDVGGAIAGLAGKLFRHALNKVAALESDEAAFLFARWTGAGRGSRYDPLAHWLGEQIHQELIVSFEDIEVVLGGPLPASADQPQWWANTTKTHTNVQRDAWRAAGYEAFLLKGQGKVRFVKAAEAPSS